MLQLNNTSPFGPAIALFADRHGVDTLYLVVKATFTLEPRVEIAEEQIPPVLADEYWGEPGASSLKFASDMHLGKPGTDVAVIGSAWGTEGKAVPQVDAGIAIADKRKLVRVFGDRVWLKDGTRFSSPQPFETLPIVYERAYGGAHLTDPDEATGVAEERNPVGLGFRGEGKDEEAEGLPLPNLEDPENPIQRWGDTAIPQGLGYVAPNWLPRRGFVGTYDDAWQKSRAPYLPEDFDPRFFNAAHPDLVFEDYLTGGEKVVVVGMSPKGQLRFTLPICDLSAEFSIAGRKETPPLNLETVQIEPDEARFCLVWRAALPCDKQALKVEQVSVDLKRLDFGGSA